MIKLSGPFFASNNTLSYEKLTRFYNQAFYVTLSYAIDDLIHSTPEDWSEEEKKYGQKILKGEKIPGDCRLVQDRFASVCQKLWRSEHEIEEIKKEVFSSWHNWRD